MAASKPTSFTRLRAKIAPMLRPMLEHVGIFRRPALWLLGRRQPGEFHLDGCVYKVHPRDFGVTLELHSTGDYERGTRCCIIELLKPGMTFVDIGAHVGLFSIPAGRCVGEQGRVFAFEPDPSNRRLLEENVRANDASNITVVPMAVADRDDRMSLHCSPYNTGDHQLFCTTRGRHTVEVEVTRLDTFMKQQGGGVDLIKMDVQGAEGRVLEGMAAVLDGNAALTLIVELSPWMLRDIGDDPLVLLNELSGRGFRLHTMDEDSGIMTAGSPDEILDRCGERAYLNVIAQRDGAQS